MTDALREKGAALQRFGVLLVLVGVSLRLGAFPGVGFAVTMVGGGVGLFGLLTVWDAVAA